VLRLTAGGHCEDPQDAQENQQCRVADRARRDSQEHVSTIEEDDQRADRVAD